jgi:arginine repressor
VSEIAILFHYCTNCDKGGFITTTEADYDSFIKEQVKLGGNSINRITFAKSIKNLTANKVLIKASRGVYQLNPLLIWNDTIEKRKEVIEEITHSDVPTKTKYLIE